MKVSQHSAMSAKRKKKGGWDCDRDPSEAKRQTLENRHNLPVVVRPTFIRIRFSHKTKEHAGLVNPVLILIPDITYLDDIANTTDYLYDIVRRILECDKNAVKLYQQNDGQWRDEEGPGWSSLAMSKHIEGGYYLCIVRTGSSFHDTC